MRTVWDENWEDMSDNVAKNTMLDAFSKSVYSSILKLIKSGEPLKILEVGCRTGRFCFALANDLPSSQIHGIDISEASISLCKKAKNAREINNIDFQVMDANDLKFGDGVFDIVFSEGVIHHLKDALKPMKEMTRVTKKRGAVIATVANWYCFPHTIHKTLKGKRYKYGFERSYKHHEIKSLFENAGLTNIEMLGVAPSYGMRRIKDHPLLRVLITPLIDLVQFTVDRPSNNWFSNKFGFQLVAKGTK